jgi:hypothetical protein
MPQLLVIFVFSKKNNNFFGSSGKICFAIDNLSGIKYVEISAIDGQTLNLGIFYNELTKSFFYFIAIEKLAAISTLVFP